MMNAFRAIRGPLAALAALCVAFGCKRENTVNIPTAKAVEGTFYIDMYEEGEVEAVKSINISSPQVSWRFGNLKLSYLVKDGTEVKAGDTVMVFDPSEVNKAIVDAEGRLEISHAELEKLIAQQQSNMEEMRADYEVTRLAHEISKIRAEQAAYESEIRKKEIKLNLDKADISLAKAKEQIENREKINVGEIRQKRLSITQDSLRLVEAQNTLQLFTVISPAPGIAILGRNMGTNNKYQVGDQAWPGLALVSLPNLSSLKATVNINEIDISKVAKGMKVEIRPDAFSEEVFEGHVASVANLAVNKQGSTKIKVFAVEILIDGVHKNLLPGLTVSCRIIIDQIDGVVYVPTEAVHARDDKHFVYLKNKGSFEECEVETGTANTNFTIIASGLGAGDEVALVDPFAAEKPEDEAPQENNSESNGTTGQ